MTKRELFLIQLLALAFLYSAAPVRTRWIWASRYNDLRWTLHRFDLPRL